jgi:hypothetical protein
MWNRWQNEMGHTEVEGHKLSSGAGSMPTRTEPDCPPWDMYMRAGERRRPLGVRCRIARKRHVEGSPSLPLGSGPSPCWGRHWAATASRRGRTWIRGVVLLDARTGVDKTGTGCAPSRSGTRSWSAHTPTTSCCRRAWSTNIPGVAPNPTSATSLPCIGSSY